MTWSCFYCTYDNEDDSATQCLLCGNPGNRTKQKAVSKSNSSGDQVVANLAEKTKAARKTVGGKPKARTENSSISASTSATASTAIDLTSPDKTVTGFSSKRKRNDSFADADTNDSGNSNASTSNQKRPERNFHMGLARRKPPPRPKVQRKQSTLSFTSVSQETSHFSHGHVFSPKTLPLDDPIRKNYQSKMQTVLKNVFGLESLRRNLQPAAIQCAMEGKSQMIVMATGGGKSLCYQLPACLLGGVTVVISPLLALMKDQTEALQSKGIPANCINSSQTEKLNVALETVFYPQTGRECKKL